MECIITRASIINRCNTDGNLHLLFTEKEKPCEESYLKEVIDDEGELCSRFFIEITTIAEVHILGERYNLDILVTVNQSFPLYTALVLYDDEIIRY